MDFSGRIGTRETNREVQYTVRSVRSHHSQYCMHIIYIYIYIYIDITHTSVHCSCSVHRLVQMLSHWQMTIYTFCDEFANSDKRCITFDVAEVIEITWLMVLSTKFIIYYYNNIDQMGGNYGNTCHRCWYIGEDNDDIISPYYPHIWLILLLAWVTWVDRVTCRQNINQSITGFIYGAIHSLPSLTATIQKRRVAMVTEDALNKMSLQSAQKLRLWWCFSDCGMWMANYSRQLGRRCGKPELRLLRDGAVRRTEYDEIDDINKENYYYHLFIFYFNENWCFSGLMLTNVLEKVGWLLV